MQNTLIEAHDLVAGGGVEPATAPACAAWSAASRRRRCSPRRTGQPGDLLIASGLEALLGDLLPDRVPYGEQSRNRTGHTLVVPGSGAWSPEYHEWMPDLVLAASASYQRVLVLPSSYCPDVPVVRRALSSDNVTALNREQFSARLLHRSATRDSSSTSPVFSPLVAPVGRRDRRSAADLLRTDVQVPWAVPGCPRATPTFRRTSRPCAAGWTPCSAPGTWSPTGRTS